MYLCQTNNFFITKKYFTYNLALAAKQKKFYLQETLIDDSIKFLRVLENKLGYMKYGNVCNKDDSSTPNTNHNHNDENTKSILKSTLTKEYNTTKGFCKKTQNCDNNASSWFDPDNISNFQSKKNLINYEGVSPITIPKSKAGNQNSP